MWSFFSRDPAKDFAYDITEEVPGLDGKSIWRLHDGKHKTTGQVVSIFVFDLKETSEAQAQLAKASFKKIKTLRHPNIITFLDGLESERVLYIVTEKVTPLENYLRENKEKTKQNELAISWGLHQITKGLSFLTNDCGLIHNNVCLWSVFVDKAGEWQLAGVDYMYPATGPDSIPPVKILPILEKYDPPEKKQSRGGKKPSENWSADMWGLGMLIWEVFNGSLPDIGSLKSLGKIPKLLVPNYCELVGANPRSRPNPAKFIDSCRAPGGFMDNELVKSMLFIEEIQIKEQSEKIAFFNKLPPALDTFPQEICRFKILPHLVHAFEFGNAGSAILAPLFKLGKLLNSEEYQQKIVPCVVKLFSSPDRATRVKLLQQMEYFVEHLQPAIVNDKVFPHVVQGFMDTNPVVREHTIKSMLHLAPKLNYKNLHDDLMKHLARLQTKDDQGGIRTNTTVCLGKIACYINPQIRQKMLLSAYLRAVKDPFPPARQAAILAMAATHMYFTLQESAMRLLPTLCMLTLDPEKGVRDQAFKAIKCYLGKLEKCSEKPELITEMEKDVLSGSSGGLSIAASWTGWAVSGALGSVTSLTSKIRGTVRTDGAGTSKTAASQAADNGTTKLVTSSSTSSPISPQTNAAVEMTSLPEAASNESARDDHVTRDAWDDDGWDNDEDWGAMDQNVQELSTPTAGGETPALANTDGWEAEDWGSLEEAEQSAPVGNKSSPASPWGASDFCSVQDPGISSSSAYNWEKDTQQGGDFFNDMITKQAKTGSTIGGSKILSSKTPAVAASSSRPSSAHSSSTGRTSSRGSSMEPKGTPVEAASGDGWDDSGWGNEETWAADEGLSKADLAKQKREERKLQRQRDLEQKKASRSGGALKLGGKKLMRD